MLNTDILKVKKAIDPAITVSIPETTRGALYTFAYNTGSASFNKSTLLKKLNAGDRAGACDEMRRWVFAGGVVWRGLKNRRETEREVCNWPAAA